MSTGLFDPGLQPERTRLAWQRTLLSIAVGCVVSMRTLPSIWGPGAFVVGAVGVLGLAVVGWTVRRRIGKVDDALGAGEPLPDGAPFMLVTVLVAGLALGALGLMLR